MPKKKLNLHRTQKIKKVIDKRLFKVPMTHMKNKNVHMIGLKRNLRAFDQKMVNLKVQT